MIKSNLIKFSFIFLLAANCTVFLGNAFANPKNIADHTNTQNHFWLNNWLPKKTNTLFSKSILKKITQNRDNPKASHQLFHSINFGGYFAADVINQSRPNFMSNRNVNIELPVAKFNLEAKPTDWMKIHVGLFYASHLKYYYKKNQKYRIDLDEATIDFSNFKKSPFYLEIGKQYLPFGYYHRFAILKSLTQSLSEIREAALQLGMIHYRGLFGAGYIFKDLSKDINNIHQNNYGAVIGFSTHRKFFNFDISANYLRSMADIGSIQNNLINNRYSKQVSGLAIQSNVFMGPFDFGVRYVSALSQFSPSDVAFQKQPGEVIGAKPQAFDFRAGYLFSYNQHENKISISYQISREAFNINSTSINSLRLPKKRIAVSYSTSLSKHVILTFQVARDRDYPIKNGGSNKFNNTATFRMAIII